MCTVKSIPFHPHLLAKNLIYRPYLLPEAKLPEGLYCRRQNSQRDYTAGGKTPRGTILPEAKLPEGLY